MGTIKVKNRKTGVESKFTPEQWERTQKNPLFEGVFVEVQTVKPPEVIALEKKKAEQQQTPKPAKAKAKSENTEK